jgi:hypothetical protein
MCLPMIEAALPPPINLKWMPKKGEACVACPVVANTVTMYAFFTPTQPQVLRRSQWWGLLNSPLLPLTVIGPQ